MLSNERAVYTERFCATESSENGVARRRETEDETENNVRRDYKIINKIKNTKLSYQHSPSL